MKQLISPTGRPLRSRHVLEQNRLHAGFWVNENAPSRGDRARARVESRGESRLKGREPSLPANAEGAEGRVGEGRIPAEAELGLTAPHLDARAVHAPGVVHRSGKVENMLAFLHDIGVVGEGEDGISRKSCGRKCGRKGSSLQSTVFVQSLVNLNSASVHKPFILFESVDRRPDPRLEVRRPRWRRWHTLFKKKGEKPSNWTSRASTFSLPLGWMSSCKHL